MQSSLAHLQVNVEAANLDYYRKLFAFLGWTTLLDQDGYLGLVGSNGASLWFVAEANGAQNDYDGRGVNHIAIGVPEIGGVDAAAGYLAEAGIAALFETPRHRPEFAMGPDQTYYQVMFESPDHMLFEVVFTGPK